jgi:SAM-dependent methyltransferase
MVLELIRDEECSHDVSKILDLGCGKGAISISLARQFGFKVRGIDIFAPFVEEARARAKELGVDDICHFEHGDITWEARGSADYDMALLVWMGGVLGSVGESIMRIRRLVRPDGYMVIGEGCFRDGVRTDHAFQYRLNDLAATREELTMHGDLILKELMIPPDKVASFYKDYVGSLRKGAQKCAANRPEHSDLLWEYVDNHEEMCRIMENTVDSYLWLLKKQG